MAEDRNAPDPPDAILETALYVADLDAAAAFYGGVIGLREVLRVPDRHVFFACGSGMLLLFVAEATRFAVGPLPVPTHGSTGAGHLCFRVDASRLDVWARRLQQHGYPIEADFQWPNGARSIYVRDPDDNSVEFSEARLWGLPTGEV